MNCLLSRNTEADRMIMASNDPDLLDPSSITLGDKIGEGGFAVVYKVRYNSPDGTIDAAAKVINEIAAEEVQFLSKFKHERIIKYFGYLIDINPPEKTTLITELAEKGDLKTRLRASTEPLPDDLLWRWIEEGAIGLEYLHENGYVHRDVKSANFLLMKDDSLKIADFGLARELDETMSTVSKGTVRWMAPEVIENYLRSKKSDVYSYGVVVWEICTRQRPFDSLPSDHAVMTAVCKGERPEIPNECLAFLQEIICSCWQAKHRQRPTMQGIVQMLQERKGRATDPDMKTLTSCLQKSAIEGDKQEFREKHQLQGAMENLDRLDVGMRMTMDQHLDTIRTNANTAEDMNENLEALKREWNLSDDDDEEDD